jgi:hypothetical protein
MMFMNIPMELKWNSGMKEKKQQISSFSEMVLYVTTSYHVLNRFIFSL